VKRIAAIVLPEIACELVRTHELLTTGSLGSDAAGRPFAVIVDDEVTADEAIDSSAILDAVDPDAWRYGARPGQSAAEAAAFVGKLNIVRLSSQLIERALGNLAEIALGFGTTAALTLHSTVDLHSNGLALPLAATISRSTHARAELTRLRYPLGTGAGPYDTVWLDVTGCARLVGGEDILCADLHDHAQRLDHRARIAIANGPRIAQAMARWKRAQQPDDLIVPQGEAAQYLADLPIAALPIDPRTMSWLGKLGILRIDDLAQLDKARLAHRLGPRAQDLLALIAGQDDRPLHAYQPPRQIVESAIFDDELCGAEPLLFVLNRLSSRAVTRLRTRGEACTLVSLTLTFDRAFIALENRCRAETNKLPETQRIELEMPVALARQDELMVAVRARLERLQLPGPVTAVELTLDGLTSQTHSQLAISRMDGSRMGGTNPNALPTLLAELSAGLGRTRVGVLSLADSHRPEARSKLVPADPHGSRPATPTTSQVDDLTDSLAHIMMPEPTRILPQPIEVGPLEIGALIGAKAHAPSSSAHQQRCTLYLVDRLELSSRIDRVQWWSASPVCRDYARAWLRTGARHDSSPRHSSKRGHPERAYPELAEAWVYVERGSGRGFLHGWYD